MRILRAGSRSARVLSASFVGALLAVVVADSFATAMLRTDHNEQMYVAAGALVAEGRVLYADFAYLQMPLLPQIYGAVYRLTGRDHPGGFDTEKGR